MQNVLRKPKSEKSAGVIIPGLVAYGKAQHARDTLKYSKSKEKTLRLLNQVMNMKSDVESFNHPLGDKIMKNIQGANHLWYVEALTIIFPIYYRLGEKEKAKRAYERARAWALDEALLGIVSRSYTLVESEWSKLTIIIPWYKKAWRQLVACCSLIGEQQIIKWKGGL